jgi:hypothetical protein
VILNTLENLCYFALTMIRNSLKAGEMIKQNKKGGKKTPGGKRAFYLCFAIIIVLNVSTLKG